MPLVTARPIGLQNGSTVTEFTDTTNTSSVTYAYQTEQTSLVIENSGEHNIFVSVGGVTNQLVKVDNKWRYDGTFTSFSIRSDVNSQEFIATAIYKVAQDLTDVNNQLTSLTTQLAQKANQHFIDVKKDFGAKGDNTTDDTAAIQAAINYCISQNGGKVFFPIGTYKVTSTLNIVNTILTRGVYIVGVDNNNTIINYSGTGYLFSLKFAHKNTISDMRLNGTAQSNHGILIVGNQTLVQTNQDNTISNLLMTDFDTAISIGDGTKATWNGQSDNTLVQDCTIANVNTGVKVRSWNSQLTRIDRTRVRLKDFNSNAGFQIGDVTSDTSEMIGQTLCEITNSEANISDRVLGGTTAFVKCLGNATNLKINSCWVEAIDYSIYFNPPITGDGQLANVVMNSVLYAPIYINRTSNWLFYGGEVRDVILNSGAFVGKFNGVKQTSAYTISGAASANAVIEWVDGTVNKQSYSGTLASPRLNTGSVAFKKNIIGCFAQNHAIVAGKNTISFTWTPTLFSTIKDVIVKVGLITTGGAPDSIKYIYGDAVKVDNSNYTININLVASAPFTVNAEKVTFHAEIMTSI